MPTPFYHLHVAETILGQDKLSESVRQRLLEQRGAFLLGNIAPDVQVVSGQERQATHFFIVPIRPDAQPAWERLLTVHPALAQTVDLSPAQTAFLAGYLCHLQADWMWILDIFAPVFGPTRTWGSFPERLYLHNVLRSYLDRQISPSLPPETAERLKGAAPGGWLPFTEDRHLIEWRDWVSQQLEPGAQAQTVEVFAARQGLSPEEFYQLLDSEERMDAEVFSRLPRPRLQSYWQRLVEANLALLSAYLPGEEVRSRRKTGKLHRPAGFIDTRS